MLFSSFFTTATVCLDQNYLHHSEYLLRFVWNGLKWLAIIVLFELLHFQNCTPPPSWSRKRVEGYAGGWAPQGSGSCSKRSCSWTSKERRGGEAKKTVWGKVLQLVLSNWKFTEPDRDSYICHIWIILLAHEHICLIKLQLGWANCRSGSCVQSAWYYENIYCSAFVSPTRKVNAAYWFPFVFVPVMI